MKIFHVITLADLGGAQSVVINLALKSLEDGHQVYVLSEVEGPMWDALPDQIVKIRINALQRSIHPLKELKVLLQLRKMYNQYRPDVVHLHSSKIGILGRLAFPPAKIVYTVHGFDSIRLAFRKFLPIEKLLKSRAKRIVGVSDYDVKNLSAEGIAANTTCIYNGVTDWPTRQLAIDPRRNEVIDILQRHSMEGKKIILTIARLSAPKRFDLFSDIAQAMKAEPYTFVWVGNQSEPANLPENVICLGEVKGAHALITYTDIFLLLSDYEGMPISVIESLAYGRPVLASNVGGVNEVLDGSNGYALSNEAGEFINKIKNLSEDEAGYKLACVAARKSYEEKFTVDKMYEKYVLIYNQING